MKLRVVHVTTVPMTLRLLGGQLEHLRRHGYDVVVVSSPGPELDELRGRNGVRVQAVHMTRRITPLRDLAGLARLVRLLWSERPDVVHAHTPKAGLLAMIAGLLTRVPVRIFQMRGLPLLGAGGTQRMLLWYAERTTCALAHRVICNSPSLREVAIREGVARASKIVVAGPGSGQGVDAEHRFNPRRLPRGTREATRARYGIPPRATVVGFVGRLVRDKGIAELADAWQEIGDAVPDLYLLVVGPFEEQRDPVPADVRVRLMEDPGVRLAGENWDTPRLYAAMDVLAFPTYREGFPNVPMEAAAMEIPVVATRIPGCVDAVVDGTTGMLVPARDAKALADALRRYLEDPSLRDRHGRAGRERMRRVFRPEDVFSAVEAQYAELVSARMSKGAGVGILKRSFDIAVAAVALLVLLPLLAVLALMVAVKMGRPVLFRQKRTGLHARVFTVYKFRTMRDLYDAAGSLRPDGDRLIGLGRFLRRTSLDELPTLWNVLRGDMSLVGPRPLLPRYVPFYDADQARRHSVRPGITGWAQVHGRNAIDWNEKFRLDVWYVDHRSFLLDLKVLVMTVGKVLAAEGIDQAGQATVQPFDEWLMSCEPDRSLPALESTAE